MTYLGDWETDQFIAEQKAEKRLLDCDGDTMIGYINIEDGDAINIDLGNDREENGVYTVSTEPKDDAWFFLREGPSELLRINSEPEVGGDVTLEAGEGTKESGDIYFTAGGKTLSLTSLLEIVQALGYDHLIDDANKPEGVSCDYEGARSVLGK